MARVLADYEPQQVLYYFEQLCAIPHGSGNVKKVADYLCFFAKLHNLTFYRDGADNVVIRKEASPGYGHLPTVILQGHTDMVCAKVPESAHDFEKDGRELILDGDLLHANGTTLGGDNGIAVAMALALLAADDIDHPKLEVVFTSDEEIGLVGAKALDYSKLNGKFLMNLDSEAEGILTVSCAGGSMTTVTLPFVRERAEGAVYTVRIHGLTGGHSGAEIHKGRANAAVLAGEFLAECGAKVISAEGGCADNAIMTECILTVCGGDIETAASVCEKRFAARFPEENIKVTCTPTGENGAEAATADLGGYLRKAPYGIQAMSKEIDGLVQTSLNVGILRTEGDAFVLTYSVRSSVESEKNALNASVKEIARSFGGDAVTEGEYPAWEYRKNSPLRDLMTSVYENMYGKQMKVEAIHAGLECGLFAGGIADLDAVSFGPNMQDIHTPREAISIESIGRTWSYLLAVLAAMKEHELTVVPAETAEPAKEKKGLFGLWKRRK